MAPSPIRASRGACTATREKDSFTDVTRQAGLLTTDGRQFGVAVGDYDNDGDPDLFVANDKTPNFLFQNNADATFSDIALASGVAYTEEGAHQPRMGADAADYDNDGHLDIVIATFQWHNNTLYHNDGDGFFTDVSLQARIARESLPYLGMTALFLDYDNDGYQDLFIANGHLDENVKEYDPRADYAQRNQLFRNNGDGTFREMTDVSGSGFRLKGVSHGAAVGDYDNDGDVDLFVSNSNGPCSLLRNEGGNRNHWLTVSTVGTRSNRDGIGARIRVVSGDLVRMKEVKSSYGYLSSNDRRVAFGLGDTGKIDELQVRWPSGIVTVIEQIELDQVLTVTEDRR